MIGTFPLRRDFYQQLFERVTDADVEDFNKEFGFAYSRADLAYVAPTIARIDDLFTGFYGVTIPFGTNFLRVHWRETVIDIEVEIIFKPPMVLN